MNGESRVLYTTEYSQAPTNMWQSRVEIKGYSVMYFDHIAVFEALYRWTSVKGGARMCFMDALISNESTKHIWAPPFKGSDVIEICDGITFDFYAGLPLHHLPEQHCLSFLQQASMPSVHDWVTYDIHYVWVFHMWLSESLKFSSLGM